MHNSYVGTTGRICLLFFVKHSPRYPKVLSKLFCRLLIFVGMSADIPIVGAKNCTLQTSYTKFRKYYKKEAVEKSIASFVIFVNLP